MADPFGFIGDTLQSAFLPDTEDEEARKYREEYERMRRTMQAQGKPAPPPIYQTRKPKNIFGGLLPEYGAGTLAKKRRGERAAWREAYDPIAMKRFQEQRKRDELQRDIGRRRQLEQIGSKMGETPTVDKLDPAFTSAAQKAGFDLPSVIAKSKIGKPAYRARTEEEESELERLFAEQAKGISDTAAAQQARARTPSVESEQRYVKNYWDAMNRGKVWKSAWQAQEAENKFTKTYKDIKSHIETETAADRVLLSKVAALYARFKQQSYQLSPKAHVDAITGKASLAAQLAAEGVSPEVIAQRAATADAKTAAMEKSALESRAFITWV